MAATHPSPLSPACRESHSAHQLCRRLRPGKHRSAAAWANCGRTSSSESKAVQLHSVAPKAGNFFQPHRNLRPLCSRSSSWNQSAPPPRLRPCGHPEMHRCARILVPAARRNGEPLHTSAALGRPQQCHMTASGGQPIRPTVVLCCARAIP